MKFLKVTAAAAALIATPTLAQDMTPEVGATVTGPQGNVVGTVEAVADGVVTLDTGKHKAPVPATAFGTSDTGPTITVTKEQLDGMIDQQLAVAAEKRDAALVVGAQAMDAEHAPLGTVLEVNGDNVVIARGGDETDKVTLLREYFSASDHGLMARLTNAQIDAAMNGSADAGSADADMEAATE